MWGRNPTSRLGAKPQSYEYGVGIAWHTQGGLPATLSWCPVPSGVDYCANVASCVVAGRGSCPVPHMGRGT